MSRSLVITCAVWLLAAFAPEVRAEAADAWTRLLACAAGSQGGWTHGGFTANGSEMLLISGEPQAGASPYYVYSPYFGRTVPHLEMCGGGDAPWCTLRVPFAPLGQPQRHGHYYVEVDQGGNGPSPEFVPGKPARSKAHALRDEARIWPRDRRLTVEPAAKAFLIKTIMTELASTAGLVDPKAPDEREVAAFAGCEHVGVPEIEAVAARYRAKFEAAAAKRQKLADVILVEARPSRSRVGRCGSFRLKVKVVNKGAEPLRYEQWGCDPQSIWQLSAPELQRLGREICDMNAPEPKILRPGGEIVDELKVGVDSRAKTGPLTFQVSWGERPPVASASINLDVTKGRCR